ncbi:MAG: penicillin-binding protein, partial [Selenomonadaceae bacterium]
TPDLVAAVWIGNDDNAVMNGMTGGMTPAIIWKNFMQKSLTGTKVKNFDGSSGISGDTIDEIVDDNKNAKSKAKPNDAAKKKAVDNHVKDKANEKQKNASEAGKDNNGGANQPTIPSPSAPEPGVGTVKGKN